MSATKLTEGICTLAIMNLSRIRTWCETHPWRVIVGVFVVMLVIGFVVSDDYATSMDEPPLFEFGMQAWRYLFLGGPVPAAIDWKFHTPVYQLLFIAIGRSVSEYGFLSSVIAMRFASFLTFCLGWWALFFLAKRVTGSPWWALLTVLWLTISPRMFAHAFYNPKDLPTLTFFTLSVLMLVRALDRPTIWRIAAFGLATGFSISLRPFALLLPMFAVLGFGLKAITAPAERRRSWILWGLASLVATFVLTIAVWPLLWTDPLGGLYGAILDNTSRTDEGFYLGAYYRPQLPWHYLIVWMAVTIPVVYSFLFMAGTGLSLARLARPLAFFREQPVIVFALPWLGLPILAKMMGRIGLFDEWRHLLFIYPAFLLIAVYGAKRLWDGAKGYWRAGLAALVLLQMLATLVWMVRWHPFEYVYFSVPSSWVKGKMEMDYWGLSYLEGLKWIAANDQSPRIPVYIRNDVGITDILMLPPEDQARIYAVKSSAQAMYIVDILRWSQYQHVVPVDRLVHTVEADGLPMLWIYRGPYETDQYPVYKT